MLLDEGVHVWGTARGHRPFLFSEPPDGVRRTALADKACALVAAESSSNGSSTKGERAPHPNFTPVVLDLADGAAAERAFLDASAQAGEQGFDIVINNAGYSVFGDFAKTDFTYWQAQIEVMLINTARLAHAALKSWGEFGSNRARALVNVSSLAVEFPLPFQAGYNAVKAGLSALSENLIVETAGSGVRVIDLRPGDYRTDFDRSVIRPELDVTDAAARSATAMPRQKKQPAAERQHAAWGGFAAMMGSGPPPEHAAQCLRRALLRRRSGTLRCGRFFQVVLAPFFVRFASLGLKRRMQALYFGL